MDDLEKQQGTCSILHQAFASFRIHQKIQTGVTVRKRSIRVKKWRFFVPRELEIWWMTLKNNRASLLYYVKICASRQNHGWIKTGVTVRKLSILVKIGILKFDGLSWKTIGHLSYAAPSFVHHFILYIDWSCICGCQGRFFHGNSSILTPL